MRTIKSSAALAALLLLASACSGNARADDEPDPAPLEGMRILLANDDSVQAAEEDGADGLGLYAIRSELCAAGADVVVFAPWGQQSGKSGGVTTEGPLGLGAPPSVPDGYAGDCAGAPSGGAVHGVCLADGPCGPDSPSATPVDAVSFALAHGLGAVAGWDGPPDLVVTGINSGPNVAALVSASGTVGAASAAQAAGVPAVALSASLGEDMAVHPGTYDAAAEFGADLIARMAAAGLLTDAYAVNVNHPHTPGGGPAAEVRWTEQGTASVLAVDYTEEDGAYLRAPRPCAPGDPACVPESKENADSAAVLEAGAVSVGVLSADRTFAPDEEEDEDDVEDLRELVESLDG
ncbi:5'/3'-nucleotidase SurE [Nocardiopsis potens]|uniref:5'/3'-nucleotidase SurE n=1 Tax=Nocardiopsis potens TaxID=1246458 RepID=UPI00034CB8D2|nr:5'/3'-nucleotidase SurE [Nocardiopsis potens]